MGMGWLLVLLAGAGISGLNVCWKQALLKGSTTLRFLTWEQGFAALVWFLVAGALYIIQGAPLLPWDGLARAAWIGVWAGLFLTIALYNLGRALALGPPGLSVAAVNGASVLPGIVTGLGLGASFGTPLLGRHLLGAGLVVLGLWWAGRDHFGNGPWQRATLLAVGSYMFFLLCMQWCALEQQTSLPAHPLLKGCLDPTAAMAVMPIAFVSSWLGLCCMGWLRHHAATPQMGGEPIQSLRWPLGGGIFHGISTLLLAEATLLIRSPLLFPTFAVVNVGLTNAWSQWMWHEPVRWSGLVIAGAGILLGNS